MKLYLTESSGNSYKVRVLASILKVRYQKVTTADIACYPYVKRAPEGGLSLVAYPAVKAWLTRCEALPGWLKLD